MEENHKNYLGIDYGMSKVGIALAHAETRLALAYTILPNDDALFDQLREIIKKEEVGTLVIGVPLHEKKESYPEREFGELVSLKLGTQVEYENEMFTTKMAQRQMILRGEKGVSSKDDALSAQLILESYFERTKAK